MKKLSGFDWVAIILVIIGAVNWGLVGAFSFDLVQAIFGAGSALAKIIYILVGLSGLWTILIASRSGSSQTM